jgi:CheY-like chemotaxis protein
LYKTLLGTAGYRTSACAFDSCDLHDVAELHPDLILLDGPWDHYGAGWDLLAGLKAAPATSQTPILVCTFADRQFGRRATETAAMGVTVLHKPFDQQGFLSAVAASMPRDSSPKLYDTARHGASGNASTSPI